MAIGEGWRTPDALERDLEESVARTQAALELMRQRPSLDLSPQPLGSELSRA